MESKADIENTRENEWVDLKNKEERNGVEMIRTRCFFKIYGRNEFSFFRTA